MTGAGASQDGAGAGEIQSTMGAGVAQDGTGVGEKGGQSRAQYRLNAAGFWSSWRAGEDSEAHVGGRVGREDAGGEPCGNNPREFAAKGSESWRSSVSAYVDSNLAGGTGGNSGSVLRQREMVCSLEGASAGLPQVASNWSPKQRQRAATFFKK